MFIRNFGGDVKEYAQTIDYNGDGNRDFLIADSETGNWYVAAFTSDSNNYALCPQGEACSNYTRSSQLKRVNLGIKATGLKGKSLVMDVNGDSFEDIVFQSGNQLKAYLNNGGNGSFRLSGNLLSFSSIDFSAEQFIDSKAADIQSSSVIDINGDGRTDLIAKVKTTESYCRVNGRKVFADDKPHCVYGKRGKWYFKVSTNHKVFLSSGTTDSPRFTEVQSLGYLDNIRATDINADGLTDILYVSNNKWYYRLSDGERLLAVKDTKLTTSSTLKYLDQFVDLNGDGRADILHATSTSTRSYVFSRPTADGKVIKFESRGAMTVGSNATVRFGDANGDGKMDMLTSTGSSWKAYLKREGIKEYAINKIINGHGVETDIDYKPLTDSSVYPMQTSDYWVDSDSISPPSAMQVVSDVSTQVNTNAKVSVSYQYGGLLFNRQGRGSLGFQMLRTIDNQTDVISETHYDQSYNGNCNTYGDTCYVNAGMPIYSEKRLNGRLLSKAVNTLGVKSSAFGGYYPYIAQSLEYSYVYGTDGNSTHVATTKTENEYDNYGNVTRQTITIDDVTSGQQMLTQTDHNYGSSYNQKRFGRLADTTVKKWRTGADWVTRKTEFTYRSNDNLLSSSTTAPNESGTTGSHRVSTVYRYDNYGNKIAVEVTAASTDDGQPTARTTRTQYDNKGRFVDYVENALGERISYRYNGGAASSSSAKGKLLQTSQADANGITTSTHFDALGRQVRMEYPDAKVTAMSYERCSGCETNAYYRINTTTTGTPKKEQYFDKWGRSVATKAQSFDGGWNTVYTTYDNQGRQATISEPNSANDITTFFYDNLHRAYLVTRPNGDQVEKRWDGNRITEENGLYQQSISFTNGFGELAWTEDAIGNVVRFSYDSFGNLLTSTTEGNDGKTSVVANTYDNWGRKLNTNDSVKGIWQYSYNGYGELYTQTTARGHKFTYQYDVLGRKIRSYEANEGTLCWNYGSTAHASSKGVGKLLSTAKYEGDNLACNTSHTGEISKSFSYNSLGLPASTTTYVNGVAYTKSQSYDSYSRPKVTTYPAGTASFAVESIYNSFGYLTQLKDNKTKTVLKHIDAMDARNKVTSLRYGNNVSADAIFESDTGRFSSMQLSHSSNPNIHRVEVTYDLIGNVVSRESEYSSVFGQGSHFTESYYYDDINRLMGRSLSISDNGTGTLPKGFTDIGSDSYRYDSLGNFTFKTGAGYYKYDENSAYKLLGVYRDAGHTNRVYGFIYDKNGNVTSDTQRTFTYDSFDKPTYIRKGDNSATMSYGTERELYSKTETKTEGNKTNTYATTYLGDFERVVRSGQSGSLTEYKYYVGGDVVITQRSNGSGSTHYLHKDHQGSIVAVTDQNGKVVSQALYDPFGKQHRLYVDSMIANFAQIEPTDRGYTGHKQLNGLDIIHMGGRIYDATLGRFLQADPFVQAPKNSQSYNRYAYVLNNPMSYTDPSGYFFLGLAKKLVRSVLKLIPMKVGNFLISLGSKFCGPWAPACAAAGTYEFYRAHGVSRTGALKAAAVAGASAYAFKQIGDHYRAKFNVDSFVDATASQQAEWVFSHSLTGGVLGVAQGGNFGSGFVSAGITKYSGSYIDAEFGGETLPEIATGTAASMVVGGTISELTGGKFSNGAKTAAFQYLFNQKGKAFFKAGKAVSKWLSGRNLTVQQQNLLEMQEMVERGVRPEDAIRIIRNRTSLPKSPTGKGSIPPSERDPKRVWTKSQKNKALDMRDGQCDGCGLQISVDQARGHHIIRHADGGLTNGGNLAILCDPCHKDIHRK